MNDWDLKYMRAIACYDLFNLYKELDPYEWEREFFVGAIETYEQLKQGNWREIVKGLREELPEIEEDTKEHQEMLDIIESIEEFETIAEKEARA